uniref:Lysine-specific demethylase-like domain-containing protein n=1 Tax=Corethron hystrix TaxID=216773 RepID=A0A7S1B4B8_9STRA
MDFSSNLKRIKSHMASSWTVDPCAGLVPIEDEERHLTFLEQICHGDIERATLLISSGFSFGKASRSRRWNRYLQRHYAISASYGHHHLPPGAALLQQYGQSSGGRTRPFLLGDLRSHPGWNRAYAYPHPMVRKVRGSFRKDKSLTSSMSMPAITAQTLPPLYHNYHHGNVVSTAELRSLQRSAIEIGPPSSRQRVAGRNEIKARWIALTESLSEALDRARQYHRCIVKSDDVTTKQPLPNKPKLNNLIDMVSSAASLPPFEGGASTVVSSSMASDSEYVEKTTQVLSSTAMFINVGRDVLATVHDALHFQIGNFEDAIGPNHGVIRNVVSLDALRKAEKNVQECPVEIEEGKVLAQVLKESESWEEKERSSGKEVDLEMARQLLTEGMKLAVPLQSVARLKHKVKIADETRKVIRQWKKAYKSGEKFSLQFVRNLHDRSSKNGISFVEATELSEFYKYAKNWIRLATEATESTCTLEDIEKLLDAKKKMSLNCLDTLVDQLFTKLNLAKEWIRQFTAQVPCLNDLHCKTGGVPEPNEILFCWLASIRASLFSHQSASLRALLTSGEAIPVLMPPLQLLRTEIDAANLTLRIRSDLATRAASEKQLHDYQKKGELLRNKLPLPEKVRERWKLEHEEELTAALHSTVEWLKECNKIFGDDSKNHRISITQIQSLYEKGTSVVGNISTELAAVQKILSTAKNWLVTHKDLLVQCGIKLDKTKFELPSKQDKCAPTLATINSALTDCADFSPDLLEIYALRSLRNRIVKWQDRVQIICPIRQSKRRSKANSKPQFEELEGLLKEAEKSLPMVNLSSSLDRLNSQNEYIQSWRMNIRCDFSGKFIFHLNSRNSFLVVLYTCMTAIFQFGGLIMKTMLVIHITYLRSILLVPDAYGLNI